MSEQHWRQQSRRTNALYGIIGWIHNTHTCRRTQPFCSFFLLPGSSARQQKAAYWTELWGGNTFHHFKMKQVSFFTTSVFPPFCALFPDFHSFSGATFVSNTLDSLSIVLYPSSCHWTRQIPLHCPLGRRGDTLLHNNPCAPIIILVSTT